jgi:hypothetical protein
LEEDRGLEEEEGPVEEDGGVEEVDEGVGRYPARRRARVDHYDPAQVELVHRAKNGARRPKQVIAESCYDPG